MIGYKVDQFKNLFFDREKVISAIDKKERGLLSRFGAFVRTRARSSIRKVGKKGAPSSPGQPPKSRTGFLKKWILFAFDPSARSVIVGPSKLNQVYWNHAGEPRGGTVPQVLEEGGQIGVLEWFRRGRWSRADLRMKRRISEQNIPTRLRTVTIAARPFMGPAFAKELPRGLALWRDAV